jgi:tryptophan halogenase
MDVPDSLTARLDLFASSGRFFKRGAAELFAEESWVQVLIGQGFQAGADPVTRFVADAELAAYLADLAEVIDDVADKMPDHAAFLAGLPAASPSRGPAPFNLQAAPHR